MTESDEQVIARVAELDAKATKGPWESWGIFDGAHWDYSRIRANEFRQLAHVKSDSRDADFIAESRTLLPDLASRLSTALAANRAKDEEIARLADAVVDLSSRYHFAVIDLVNAHNSEDPDEISKAVAKIRAIAELIQKSINDDDTALALAESQPKEGK